MRCYDCYIYHFQNNQLIQNSNQACWAGLNRVNYNDKNGKQIKLDSKTKDYIYIDKYIEKEITDKQRKRIVYLLNKITPCKFVTIEKVKYIQYKLLSNHYSNLELITQAENTKHAYRVLGHKPVIGNSVINQEIADQIRKDHKNKLGGYGKLAVKYNVSKTTIAYVIQGKIW